MLLTAIGTDKKLCSGSRQFDKATIIQVSNPFINQVQVDVNIGLYSLLAKPCDSGNIGVGRRC